MTVSYITILFVLKTFSNCELKIPEGKVTNLMAEFIERTIIVLGLELFQSVMKSFASAFVFFHRQGPLMKDSIILHFLVLKM